MPSIRYSVRWSVQGHLSENYLRPKNMADGKSGKVRNCPILQQYLICNQMREIKSQSTRKRKKTGMLLKVFSVLASFLVDLSHAHDGQGRAHTHELGNENGYLYFHDDLTRCYNVNYGHQHWCSNTNPISTGQLSEVTYTSSQSAVQIQMPYYLDAYWWCCLHRAYIYVYNESTLTYDDVTNSRSTDLPMVQSFASEGRDYTQHSKSIGMITLYTTDAGAAWSPSRSVQLKIRIENSQNSARFKEWTMKLNYIDECVANVLSSTKALSIGSFSTDNSFNYNIPYTGTGTSITVTTQHSSSQPRCNSAVDIDMQMLVNGQWTSLTDLSTGVYSFVLTSKASSSTQQTYTFKPTSINSFPGSLTSTVTYSFRTVYTDPVSTDLSNPMERSFSINVSYACTSRSFTVSSVPADVTYEVNPVTSYNYQVTRTSSASNGATNCMTSGTSTVIQIWQDSDWLTIVDGNNNKVNDYGTVAPWLFVAGTSTRTYTSGTDKGKATFEIKALYASTFSNYLVEPVTYSLRAYTVDIWTGYELSQAFTVTFSYKCSSAVLSATSNPSSEYLAGIVPMSSTQSIRSSVSTSGNAYVYCQDYDHEVQLLVNEDWVTFYKDGAWVSNTIKTSYPWITSVATLSNQATVYIKATDAHLPSLYEPRSYYFRFVQGQKWVDSLYTSFEVYFSHDCGSNYVSLHPSYSLSDVAYTIPAIAASASTSQQMVGFTFTKNTCTDIVYLLEILEEGQYVTVFRQQGTTGTPMTSSAVISRYNWLSNISVYVSAMHYFRYSVKTADYATYDNQNMDNSEFHLRMTVYDAHGENYNIQTNTVTINYACDSDSFSFATSIAAGTPYGTEANQQFALQSADTITINYASANRVTHSIAQCPFTQNTYIYNNSTQVWEDYTASDLYSKFAITIPANGYSFTIGDKAGATVTDMFPEQTYKFKFVWISTYSELDDSLRQIEDIFDIRFYDPCMNNQLSLTNIEDYTYTITYETSQLANYNRPTIDPKIKGTDLTCSYTASCSIWSDTKDIWEGTDCNAGVAVDYTDGFVASTGQYYVAYSLNELKASGRYATKPIEDVTYYVRIQAVDARSYTDKQMVETFFHVTITYPCGELSIATDLTQELTETEVIIGSGTTVTRTMALTTVPSPHACTIDYALDIFDDNKQRWVPITETQPSYVTNFDISSGMVSLKTADVSFDQVPSFNVLARISASAPESENENNYAEDIFRIVIVEECRKVTIETPADLTDKAGGTGLASTGTVLSPHTADMFNQKMFEIKSGVVYSSPLTNPTTLQRCSVQNTLHYNDADRTPVDTTKYRFADVMYSDKGNDIYTHIMVQWDTAPFDDYFVVITKVIYDQGSYTATITTDESFLYMRITNPCLIADGGAITAQAFAPIDYWVKAAESKTSKAPYQDVPTTNYGGQTYLYQNQNEVCGAKSYALVEADKVTPNTKTAYMNLSSDIMGVYLKIQTNDPVHATNAATTYYLRVTLDDYVNEYPNEAQYYEQVDVNIRNCVLSDIDTTGWVSDFEYILHTPVEKLPYTAWTGVADPATVNSGQANDCGYTLNYELKWRNFYDTRLEIPVYDNNVTPYEIPWFEWHADLPAFWIQSDDTINLVDGRQTYQLELRAYTSDTDMNPIIEKTETFQLTVVNTCLTDTLSKISDTFRPDYTYYIAEKTENYMDDAGILAFTYSSALPYTHTEFTANWSTSVEYCPLDFELVRDFDGDGNYQALTSFETPYISLINKMPITKYVDGTYEEQYPSDPYYQDPQVTLQILAGAASDIDVLDGEVWKLAVNRVSTESQVNNDASRVEFTLNFKDVCWDIPIVQAEPAETTKTVTLWDYFTFDHDGASTIQADLGWPNPTTYCGGGFTHRMIYDSTNDGSQPDAASSSTLMNDIWNTPTGTSFGTQTSFFSSTKNLMLTGLDWVGEHVMYIRTTIGTEADKLYESNYRDSDYFTLTVLNPCNSAEFTVNQVTNFNTMAMQEIPKVGSGGTTPIIEARLYNNEVIFQYETPYDTASTTYGPNIGINDRRTLCGQRTHFLTLEDETIMLQPQSGTDKFAPWLTFEYFPADRPPVDNPPRDPVDVYRLRINGTSVEDLGSHLVTMHFGLEDYPLSTVNDERWQLLVYVEYCLPTSWLPPSSFETYFTIGMKPMTIQYDYVQWPCEYEATYSVELLEISGVRQFDEPVPSFVNQDSRSGYMAVFSNDVNDLGWYVLQITATLDVVNNLGDMDPNNDPDNDFLNSWLYQGQNKIYGIERPPPGLVYESSFNITLGVIEVNETSVLETNSAPYMLPPPDSQVSIIAGQAWSYEFGRIFDFENNNVNMRVELRNAKNIVNFDADALTLSIRAGATDQQTQPLFEIQIILEDDHPTDPLSKIYTMTLVIVKDYTEPAAIIIEETRTTKVLKSYNGRVFDLQSTSIDSLTETQQGNVSYYSPQTTYITTGFESLAQENEDAFEDDPENPKPAPAMDEFSNDGTASLKFNTPMIVPDLENIEALFETEVALRIAQDVREEVWATEDGVGRFQIRKGIEVRIDSSEAAEDQTDIEFSWEIVEFTPYEVKFQFYFEQPEAVSTGSSDPDIAVITFWAVDLFKAENGKSMKPGFTVKVEVTRQVDKDDIEEYKNWGQYAGFFTLILLSIGLFLTTNMNADTLPIWACYDTLVLISHLPMVNVTMPGSAAIVLAEFAKVLRLEFIPLHQLLEDSSDIGNSGNGYSNLMVQNKYESTSILLNLSMFMAIFLFLVLAQIISSVLDIARAKGRIETTPQKTMTSNGRSIVRPMTMFQKSLNILMRFLMVTFLEFFICCLINLKASSERTTDFESISRIVSIFYVVLLLLLVCLFFVMAVLDSDPRRDQNMPPPLGLQTMYLGMDNKRRNASNLYIIFQMIRYAVYALAVVLLDEYPTQQLQILIVSSWIIMAIVVRGQHYKRTITRYTVIGFELAFVWCCTLCFVFSPEYSYRSFTISKDMGTAICGIAGVCLFAAFALICHSMWWQSWWVKEQRLAAMRQAELERRKQALEELQRMKMESIVEESEEESYRDIRAQQRQRMRQRKVRAMEDNKITKIEDPDEMEEFGATRKYLNDEDEELNELEKLAGIEKQAPIDKLDISDEEYEEAPQQERPNSVGAESSYSDFMQQWKNKLFTEDQAVNAEQDAPAASADDIVSNHSRRSKGSVDSPFINLTKQQTQSLLKGPEPSQKASAVIPEEYEDSAESDDDPEKQGIILSKTERRRLNMLSDRRQNSMPTENQKSEFGATNGGLSGMRRAESNVQPIEEEEEYDLL